MKYYRTSYIIALVSIAGFWGLIWAINSGLGNSKTLSSADAAPVSGQIQSNSSANSVSVESILASVNTQPIDDSEIEEVIESPSDVSVLAEDPYTARGLDSIEQRAELASTASTSEANQSSSSASSTSSSASSGSSGASSGSSGGSGDTSSGTNATGTSTGGGIGNLNYVTVAALPEGVRFLKDDISMMGTSTEELYCAKNESEAFQIFVINKSNYPIRDIEIHASDWQGEAGIKKPVLTLFREHYVKTEVVSRGLPKDTPVGWYPSALIPFVDPYTGNKITRGLYRADHASIYSKENQAYWVDIRVDSDVPAGTYTCKIQVTSQDILIAQIPVTLHVWDFELPAVHKWTVYTYWVGHLSKIYGLREDKGSAFDTITSRHNDMLYEQGIYPPFQKYPAVDDGGNVNFRGYTSSLAEFIKKYGPGVLRIPFSSIKDNFDDDGNNPVGAQILSDYQSFSIQHPEYGTFFYRMDEPYKSIEETNQALNIHKLIEDYAPSIKLLTNGDVFADYLKDLYIGSRYHPVPDPEYQEYEGLAEELEAASDIRSYYCRTQMQSYTTPESLEANIRKSVADGKSVWICLTSRLEQNPLLYRIGPWRGYILGVTGQLEWRPIPSYDPSLDPWVDPVNLGGSDPDFTWNGYDQYIYPGTPEKTGISSPGGPIATIGLKILRTSVEDYAYFKLAESLTDHNTVADIVSSVAPDFETCFSSGAYETARKKIAKIILDNQ